MTEPEQWILLEVKSDEPHYRVFASWAGGYITGDTWKLNSGILGVNNLGEYYDFIGYSGSVYRCHKDSYGVSKMHNKSVLDKIIKGSENTIFIVQDYLKVIESFNIKC
jgi:hypothetical protein